MAAGSKIIQGLTDAIAYAKGQNQNVRVTTVERPEHIDVRAIRAKLEMSQEAFAEAFNFSLGTLRNWEQGVREPSGPARVLLILIERIPEQIRSALQAA